MTTAEKILLGQGAIKTGVNVYGRDRARNVPLSAEAEDLLNEAVTKFNESQPDVDYGTYWRSGSRRSAARIHPAESTIDKSLEDLDWLGRTLAAVALTRGFDVVMVDTRVSALTDEAVVAAERATEVAIGSGSRLAVLVHEIGIPHFPGAVERVDELRQYMGLLGVPTAEVEVVDDISIVEPDISADLPQLEYATSYR